MMPLGLAEFDAQLGWRLKPGATGVSYRSGERVDYQINSKGLRDDETSYEEPSDIFRILLLGDSHAFGYGVNMARRNRASSRRTASSF
jgi:hypothetical protein